MEAEELRCIMETIDTNGSGTLSIKEFIDGMQNEQVQHALHNLGVEIKDPELYFRNMAAAMSTDEVDLNDLVTTVMRLKGSASSVDLHSLISETVTMKRNMGMLIEQQGRLIKA